MSKEKKTADSKAEEKVAEKEAEKVTCEEADAQPENTEATENEKHCAEIEKLKEELASANDKFLRTAAEYDNFRRRSQAEKEAIYNNSKSDTIAKLVPVMDNFERAAAAQSNPEDYKKGIEMIVKQFSDTLTSLGVESFGEAGEQFDPNIHNGVSHVDDESLGENVIHTVYQKGYKIGDRIIRHAVVIVAN